MSITEKTYRYYSLDGGRNILNADWLHATTDDDAVAEAITKVQDSYCEVWEGQRMVAAFGTQDHMGVANVGSAQPTEHPEIGARRQASD